YFCSRRGGTDYYAMD
nr:immunoglobulin heavy chain junction region [Mus musculus]